MSDDHLQNVRVRDLMPGVWEDATGKLHISAEEVNLFFGFPNTPEGNEETARMIVAWLEKNEPQMALQLRLKPDPAPPLS